jgi:multiple sugar transport system permease protein
MRLVIVLSFLLSAAARAGEPTVLKLWTIPDTSSPSVDAQAAARVLEQFQRDHPEVVLRKTAGISIPQIGGSAAILMAIAGGVAPDVIESTQQDIHNFVQQGFLAPLDEYLAGIPEEELWERAPRQVWAAARFRGSDGQEHIYALPKRFDVSTMKVRRDLAAKLGYPENKLPRTWDEVYAMAQAVTDPEAGRYGVGLPKGSELAFVFHSLLVSAGGRAIEQRANGELYAAWGSEEGVMALDFLWRLVRGPWERDGKRHEGVAYSDVNMWDSFKRGRYLIGFTSLSSDRGILSAADPERFRLLPMPRAPNGRNIPTFTTQFAGVFAGQTDARARRMAFDYLWFRDSREARRLRTETFVKAEQGQNVNPLDLKLFGYREELQKLPAGYLEFYEDSIQRGHVQPFGRGASEILRDLNNPVQRALSEEFRGLSDELRRARLLTILEETAARTNSRLHNPLTTAQVRTRKTIALLASATIFAGFLCLFWVVHRAYAPPTRTPGHASHQSVAMLTRVGLILFPALALVALWEYYPLIRGTIIAFQDYRFLTGTRFVGLDNFIEVLFSPFFWAAMGRTLLYVAISIGLGFFTPIFLAILLHEIPRGKVFFRVLYYLPALTTGIVVIFLWKTFFEPGPSGYLNHLLGFLHIAPQRWLDDPTLAMLCCVLPTVWAGMGPGSLIYLAALKSIPEDIFEAASIDGCGFFNKVRLIALPYMKPLIIMNFVGVFIGTFQSSGYILILTGGGPDNATLVASLEIFYSAYARLNFGAATAMSWVLAFSLIGFTLFQAKYLSKVEFRSASAR